MFVYCKGGEYISWSSSTVAVYNAKFNFSVLFCEIVNRTTDLYKQVIQSANLNGMRQEVLPIFTFDRIQIFFIMGLVALPILGLALEMVFFLC